jgi:hypothetical protein
MYRFSETQERRGIVIGRSQTSGDPTYQIPRQWFFLHIGVPCRAVNTEYPWRAKLAIAVHEVDSSKTISRINDAMNAIQRRPSSSAPGRLVRFLGQESGRIRPITLRSVTRLKLNAMMSFPVAPPGAKHDRVRIRRSCPSKITRAVA